MLELHTLTKINKISDFWGTPCGIGPFFAVQPDSSGTGVISAYSLGLMFAIKKNNEETDKSSWNIGAGYVVNTNVKTLGDGIEENKPQPQGETEIRYKYTNQPGWLVIVSFSF